LQFGEKAIVHVQVKTFFAWLIRVVHSLVHLTAEQYRELCGIKAIIHPTAGSVNTECTPGVGRLPPLWFLDVHSHTFQSGQTQYVSAREEQRHVAPTAIACYHCLQTMQANELVKTAREKAAAIR
jgi:hypothetical protein